mmetsp:Transcript_16791/g.27590  ORF Transcript_16791/g.27590 Transcript_16791/m.27590 type:complete len:414 (-) Transcript_16791:1363-2604(-)
MSTTKLNSYYCKEVMMMLHYRSSSQPYPRRKVILFLFSVGFFLGITFFSHQLESNLDDELLAARNNALRSSSTQPNNANKAKKKISYITSFWAKDRQATKVIPHRREIEAALLANIYNPHIDQVVVFLDGVSTDDAIDEEHKSSCVHFNQDMAELSRQFLQRDSSNSIDPLLFSVDPMSKVTCVNVITGQPTYYQMFLNALSNVVTGDIVVMANADMAFDDSIAKARKLKEDVLLVLGTRGFSTNAIPASTRQFYDVIVRSEYTDQQLKDSDRDQCSNNPWSWDTWVFHKDTIQGKLHEEHFQRPSVTSNEMTSFYMNENGAENAALWAMEQSTNFATTYNACDEIHSWSFHLTPRTHHSQGKSVWSENGDRPYIPKPWGGQFVRPRWNGMRKSSPPYPPKWCENGGKGCFFD